MLIGLISDTHGMLSRDAVQALDGVDHILHAGDVGAPDILDTLNKVAPVTAVRGNMDGGDFGKTLSPDQLVELDGYSFYILHNLNGLDLDPATAGIHAVISGHTHQPEVRLVHDVLYVNPGSASYSRQGGPLSVGRILISENGLQPEIVMLST